MKTGNNIGKAPNVMLGYLSGTIIEEDDGGTNENDHEVDL